jgi:hypothetical protein
VRRIAVAAAFAVALAGSGSTPAARVASTPQFVFGRSGGNIQPFSVTVARDGRVTARGAVTLARPDVVVPAAALRALLTLAKAEGFYSWPAARVCRGTLPDFASLFVAVTTARGTRKVTVRGSCNQRFAQLYAILGAVAGVE